MDNRPGAGGIIGLELAAKAPADGYTLVLSSSAGLVIQPLLTKVPYDTHRDFTPISLVVISPQMLVASPSLPATTVDELVSLARAKPRPLHCASPGTGTSNHLGCEMLKMMGGIDIVHVPYKGTSPAIHGRDGRAGAVHVQQHAGGVAARESWKAARDCTRRNETLAGRPERADARGDASGISVPDLVCAARTARNPTGVLSKLNAEAVKMLNDPAFAKRLSDQGQDPQASSPAELSAYMRAETERSVRVVKAAGLTSSH